MIGVCQSMTSMIPSSTAVSSTMISFMYAYFTPTQELITISFGATKLRKSKANLYHTFLTARRRIFHTKVSITLWIKSSTLSTDKATRSQSMPRTLNNSSAREWPRWILARCTSSSTKHLSLEAHWKWSSSKLIWIWKLAIESGQSITACLSEVKSTSSRVTSEFRSRLKKRFTSIW